VQRHRSSRASDSTPGRTENGGNERESCAFVRGGENVQTWGAEVVGHAGRRRAVASSQTLRGARIGGRNAAPRAG
jgi:hypothetical protein